jgi:hypothetical protein
LVKIKKINIIYSVTVLIQMVMLLINEQSKKILDSEF